MSREKEVSANSQNWTEIRENFKRKSVNPAKIEEGRNTKRIKEREKWVLKLFMIEVYLIRVKKLKEHTQNIETKYRRGGHECRNDVKDDHKK